MLEQGQSHTDGAVPGPGFWALPDAEIHCAAPWNGGAFRAARDQLFIAAVRLHRAFIVAAVRTIKPSLNTMARAAQGGPDAPSYETGSNDRRSDSPTEFRLSTSSAMARPGNRLLAQLMPRYCSPSLTIPPQVGAGGCTPRPR